MAYNNDFYFWTETTPTRENRYDERPNHSFLHQCGAGLCIKESYRRLWVLSWRGHEADLEGDAVPFKQAERVLLNWMLIEHAKDAI